MDPEFQDNSAPFGQLSFKFIDFVISPLPVFFSTETFQTLHHHPPVPGSVKYTDMTGTGKPCPETPQVMAVQLMRKRGCDRMYVKSPRIQRIGNPADVASFSGGIPSFIAQDHRDFFLINLVMKFTEPGLVSFQFMLVIFFTDGWRKIHIL